MFCSGQPQLSGAGRAGTRSVVQPGPGGARLPAHTHDKHAKIHERKVIFDKKNQDDTTFYDQTVIHTQAVDVQKALNYSLPQQNWPPKNRSLIGYISLQHDPMIKSKGCY